jgi:hypothetical protein
LDAPIKKRRWFQYRLSTLISVVFVAGVLVGTFVVPYLDPGSKMNCRVEEINIRTGQARYTRYLWHVRISQRVEDTPLSLALGGEDGNLLPYGYDPGHSSSDHLAFLLTMRTSPPNIARGDLKLGEAWQLVTSTSFAHQIRHAVGEALLGWTSEFEKFFPQATMEDRKFFARSVLTKLQRDLQVEGPYFSPAPNFRSTTNPKP